MNRTISIAPVRKTIVVQAAPAAAFEVFTARIDRWWPKTHNIGKSPILETVIEAFVGGRWYSKLQDGSEVVVGHVRIWEPAQRFTCSWEIDASWQPDARAAFASEIEVRFVAEAPGRTRVELEHRDFERMGPAGGETMRSNVDQGWPGLLDRFAREAAESPLS